MSGHHPALQPALSAFHARHPPRIWSLLVSFLGDAVLPRGGVVQAGVLSRFGEIAGIEPGLVRTALSRLVARETLARERKGRASFYRLTAPETAAFHMAADRIYGRNLPQPTGHWDVLLIDRSADRAGVRDTAIAAGYMALGSTTLLRPQHEGRPGAIGDGWHIVGPVTAGIRPEYLWPLADIAASYRRFLQRFSPLATAGQMPEEDALLARVLLAHEFRRIVLRDPAMAAPALPQDWPAEQARDVFGKVHALLSPGAERWLDRHMT